MADKFDPQIIAELKKQNEELKANREAQKQSDIEAKKYSAEQVAEIRKLASSNKKGVSKAAKEQAQNDIKQLDNQAKLLGISAEELTARQREKDDIEAQKQKLDEMKAAIEAAGGNADENLALQREQASIAKQEARLEAKNKLGMAGRMKEEAKDRAASLKATLSSLTSLEGLKDGLKGLGGGVVDMAKKGGGGLMDMLKKGALALALPAIFAFVNSKYFDQLKNFIMDKAVPAVMALVDVFKTYIIPALTSVFNFLMKEIYPIIEKVFIDTFKNIKNLFGDIKGAFDKFASGDFLGGISDLILGIGKFFRGIMDTAITAIYNVIASIFGLEKSDSIFGSIKNFFTSAYDSVVGSLSKFGNFIKDTVMSGFNNIKKFFGSIFSFGKDIASKIFSGANFLLDFVKEKFQNVIGFFKDLFSFKPGDSFATKFIDIILAPYNLAINFIRDIFGFGKDEQGNVKPFSLGKFIMGIVDDVIDWFGSFFDFDIGGLMSGDGDAMKSVLRAMLPAPDFLSFTLPEISLGPLGKFGGQKINLNPIPDGYYKMAGIDPKTGLDVETNKNAVESVTTDPVAEAEKKKFITGSEQMKNQQGLAGQTTIIDVSDKKKINQPTTTYQGQSLLSNNNRPDSTVHAFY
jgi:hypothetical protein|tara:strand:+ start:1863 stop:3761 length:1899 start_codon:yes stop_codon:yes gene_type:complete